VPLIPVVEIVQDTRITLRRNILRGLTSATRESTVGRPAAARRRADQNRIGPERGPALFAPIRARFLPATASPIETHTSA
jgi:hypothetical protein